jgi:hypothetical protein
VRRITIRYEKSVEKILKLKICKGGKIMDQISLVACILTNAQRTGLVLEGACTKSGS